MNIVSFVDPYRDKVLTGNEIHKVRKTTTGLTQIPLPFSKDIIQLPPFQFLTNRISDQSGHFLEWWISWSERGNKTDVTSFFRLLLPHIRSDLVFVLPLEWPSGLEEKASDDSLKAVIWPPLAFSADNLFVWLQKLAILLAPLDPFFWSIMCDSVRVHKRSKCAFFFAGPQEKVASKKDSKSTKIVSYIH